MDPLTLALIAGGATAVQNLPAYFKSDLEKDQAKRLKELQRREELGALGLSDKERAALNDQFSGAQAQAAAQQKALMGQYSAQTGQPGQAALGMVAAGEAQRNLAAQQAQAVTQADIAEAEKQRQEMIDLQAALSEQKRARQEALVAPLTQGIEAFAGAQNLAALSGQPGLLEQRQIKKSTEAAQKAADLAAQTAKNDAMVAQALAVSRMQQEWGLTPQQAEAFYKSSDWANLSPETQSYYTRIK